MALGRSIDAVVVAPATARLIGSYSAGISSDLLTATLLATRAPVLICPAMHAEMWEHPSVQDNVALLRRRGVHVLDPAEGRLAGGDYGKGRLPDAHEIVAALATVLGHRSGPLAGVTAVVTAGGTREALDPVRYIANRSSGKQGYAVAAELYTTTGKALTAPTEEQRRARTNYLEYLKGCGRCISRNMELDAPHVALAQRNILDFSSPGL